MNQRYFWISVTTVTLMATGSAAGQVPYRSPTFPIPGTSQTSSTSTPPPACLHGADESPDHETRRLQALRLTRLVNSSQSAEFSLSRTYQPLNRLITAPNIPQGFVVHLATDGESYLFSAKDTLDPCGFAYFSDENGVIYTGQPLR